MTSSLRLSSALLLPLLGACQSPAPTEQAAPAQPALWQLEAQLTAGDLEAASAAFDELQRLQAGNTLEAYQRRLAEAWLQRSQQALEAGDLNAATAALARARALLPQAPALINDLGSTRPAPEAAPAELAPAAAPGAASPTP